MLREQRNDILYILYESEYILEDGHSKKVKARHNEKKKNIEKRFYDNMNYKHSHTDEKGNKHGTVKRGDGPEVPITIHKKRIDAHCEQNVRLDDGEEHFKPNPHIHISKSEVRAKGSDMAGSHEYAHGMDNEKIVDILNSNKKVRDILKSNIPDEEKEKKLEKLGFDKLFKKAQKEINKSEGFDKLSRSAIKENKIKNEHDKEPEEMKSDYYANTTTKGENNTNRFKKHLNEVIRRDNQHAMSSNKRIIHKNEKDVKHDQKKLKKMKDDIDNSNASPLTKTAAKSMLSAGRLVVKAKEKSIKKENDKIKKHHEDVKQKNKRDTETRKKTNDYIMKKKKEENK